MERRSTSKNARFSLHAIGAGVALVAFSACGGAAGGGAGGGNGGGTATTTNSSTTTSQTTTSTTTTGSSTTSSGAGGSAAFMCGDVSTCDTPDPAACACYGCSLGLCDDAMGGLNDCVCPNCAADPFCTDTSNCTDDGVCDPATEGCICADCALHPQCAQ